MKQANKDAMQRLQEHARTAYKRGYEAGYARCKMEMELAAAEKELRDSTAKLNQESAKILIEVPK